MSKTEERKTDIFPYPGTKIVATIGPACDTEEMIEHLIRAGVNVFRFNLKHNVHEWHSTRIRRVNDVAQKIGIPVAVLLDLQGPEIRTGPVSEGKLVLKAGDTVYMVPEFTGKARPEITFPNPSILLLLVKETELQLDDGKIHMVITTSGETEVIAHVAQGGILGDRKTVNIPALSHDLPALVDKDIQDIALASREDVDFIALSFVRTKGDIEILREELRKQEVEAHVIAKIETSRALDNFEEIVRAADGVMVARGDLGVEMPIEQVPFYQKRIIRRCLEEGKPVITATQMLEHMIDHPYPTRAEVSDVANAVYDCSDALMLSAETASGNHPEEAVKMMHKIIAFNDKKRPRPEAVHTVRNQTDALMISVNDFSRQILPETDRIAAYVVLTETGDAVKSLSRLRPPVPIIALTRHKEIRDQLLLVWGVVPILFEFSVKENSQVTQTEKILDAARKANILKKGEKVIVTYGERWGISGNTNVMRIEEV